MSIEFYSFYAMNGFTIAVILSLYKFLKQVDEKTVKKKNLEVGIYVFGYLVFLLLLTFFMYKRLHLYLLINFYLEP